MKAWRLASSGWRRKVREATVGEAPRRRCQTLPFASNSRAGFSQRAKLLATLESMGFVYVLTNPVMPGLVKIGCTDADDADTRIAQLYTTGVPVPFKIEFAARVENMTAVESALHQAFAPNRINPKREFFRLEPDQPIAILKLLHVQDATAEVATGAEAQVDDQSNAAAEQQLKRRPRFNFEEMGIPVGAVLKSTRDPSSVIVVDDRQVKFGDEVLSLSAVTKSILQLDYYVAPGPYWTYNGKLLRDIYNETYPSENA